jgi:hypothetical protein
MYEAPALIAVAGRAGLVRHSRGLGFNCEQRETVAVSLAGVYLAACVWALWSRLDAILLLAFASPVAASFMFPKGVNRFTRILVGVLIDISLVALAFVPVLGDLFDLGASAVAAILLVMRFRQFASSIPGGIACLLLFLFLWSEAGFLPRRLSVSGIHHTFWFYPAVVIASVLAGAAILVLLTLLLGLVYDGDRAKAVFCTVGFPWYLITFFLTIFLPNRHVKRVHQAAGNARPLS